MKNILFPTDFSDNAENAFRFAMELALSAEAHIDLLHTFRTPADYRIPGDMVEDMLEKEKKEVRALLEKVIQDNMAIYKDARKRITIEPVAMQGFTADIILEVARERDSTLIVMGTQGATGWDKALVGSMTASVIEHATIPVLAIPEGAKYQGINKIVYGSDFSDSDFEKIGKLSRFASYFDAKVHCVHISEEEDYFTDDVAFNIMQEQFYMRYPNLKESVDFKVLMGDDVEDGLKAAVDAYQADMLAMTTQKKNFFDRLFGKSETERMVYDTDVPLLAFSEND